MCFEPSGVWGVDILVILGGLLLALVVAGFSSRKIVF